MFSDHTESTVMSLLHGVTTDLPNQKRESLQRFCHTYTLPLVNFLATTKRISTENAEEVVQEFWLAKMIEPRSDDNLVSKYLRVRVSKPALSFRQYLARSLQNHFVSHFRSSRAKFDRRTAHLESAHGWEPAVHYDQHDFDAAWANHLLQRVLNGVSQECETKGHRPKWEVFVELVLRPSLQNCPRPGYDELASRLGFRSPQEVGNAWITVKRMFMRHFNHVVQDYLPAATPEESLTDTVTEVRQMLLELSRSGTLRISAEQWGVEITVDEPSLALRFEPFWKSLLLSTVNDLATLWNELRRRPLEEILEIEATHSAAKVSIEKLIAGRQVNPSSLSKIRQSAKDKGLGHLRSEVDLPDFPAEIFGLIYFLSIAAAQVYFQEKITSQTNHDLRKKTRSLLDFPWLDSKSAALLDRFSKSLSVND